MNYKCYEKLVDGKQRIYKNDNKTTNLKISAKSFLLNNLERISMLVII